MSFLDGDLDPVREDILFSKLAEDQSLRFEMKEMLSVNRLAQLDAESMLPPTAWKVDVMGAVATVNIPEVSEKKNTIAGAGWWRGSFLILLALFVGSVGTLGIQKMLQGDQNTEEVLAANETNTITTNAHDVAETPSPDPHEISAKQVERPSSSPGSVRLPLVKLEEVSTVASTSPRATNSTDTVAESLKAENEPRAVRLTALSPRNRSLADTGAFMLEKNLGGRSKTASLPQPLLNQVAETDKERQGEAGLEVATKTSFAIQEKELATTAQSTDPLGEVGISLSLLYRLDNHHKLGIEVGRQRTPQVFRGVEGNQVVRYEQTPTLNRYGLLYQYSSNDILKGVRPVLQGMAGFTETGPVGNALLGAEYAPDSRISLMAGVQGSLSLYRFQENWYSSPRLDFTYGVAVKF